MRYKVIGRECERSKATEQQAMIKRQVKKEVGVAYTVKVKAVLCL